MNGTKPGPLATRGETFYTKSDERNVPILFILVVLVVIALFVLWIRMLIECATKEPDTVTPRSFGSW